MGEKEICVWKGPRRGVEEFEEGLRKAEKEWEERASKVFSGYKRLNEGQKRCFREAVSNVCGGVGYYYGSIKVL